MVLATLVGLTASGLGYYFSENREAREWLFQNPWIQDAIEAYIFPVIMIWMGLLMLSAFWPLISNFFRKRQVRSRLKMTGQKGMAKVIAVEDTGIQVNNNPYVKFTLEINGKKSELTTLASRVAIPRVGDSIAVVYDPGDPTVLLAEHEM